jgi:MFS family permease
MSSAGFAIGLILGGVLTETASWRWVLFINVPFGLVASFLAPRFLRQPPRHATQLDLGGAITATAGVGSLVYGLIHAASSGWSSGLTIAPIAAGLVLIAGFVVLQTRVSHPLIPLHLFKDRNRAAAYANYLLGPAAGFSSFFFLTQYLQDVLHYSPVRTGFAFLPMATLVFTMSRLIPRLLPRFGPKPLTIVGTVLLVAGLIGFTQIGAHSTYFGTLLWPMIVMGLGMGMAFSPLMVLIMHSVRPEDAGAAGGTMQTLQQTGVSLGIAVLVTIAGTAARNHPATALLSSETAAITGSAVVAALTVFVALTFKRIEPR